MYNYTKPEGKMILICYVDHIMYACMCIYMGNIMYIIYIILPIYIYNTIYIYKYSKVFQLQTMILGCYGDIILY